MLTFADLFIPAEVDYRRERATDAYAQTRPRSRRTRRVAGRTRRQLVHRLFAAH
ncbi:MAG: hypothetical protein ACRDOY_02400 [Nocardioidaceae bacterium]